jgi:hypothetical protein
VQFAVKPASQARRQPVINSEQKHQQRLAAAENEAAMNTEHENKTKTLMPEVLH